MTYSKDMGNWGETVASQFLQDNNYSILDRNYFTRYGEIDIVSLREDVLVFVEVKTRSSIAFGMPEESITEKKREHLINAALLYLSEHPEYEEWEFDLITVEGKLNSINPVITNFRNAIIE